MERKNSLLSTKKFSNNNDSRPHLPPEDKYFLMRILFLLTGVSAMVSMSFFLTATDYWMYKFRDVSEENYDPNNKTFLQTNFASITSMLSSIPIALTTVLVSVFGHKVNLRLRLLGTMIALSTSFISFAILAEVNTDSWQLGFFILTMIVSIVNTFFGITFSVSNYTFMAKFPPEYIKLHVYGNSMSGIISSFLQIFSLAVGGNSSQVALIYFLCGATILIATAVMIYISKYVPLYQHYMEGVEKDTNKSISFADLKEVSKRIWPILLPLVLTIPVSDLSSTPITILIVSENKGVWGKKYFMPVATFLLSQLSTFLGRIFAAPVMTHKNAKWFILLILIQAYGVGALVPFCNAKPRSHLPILFPHDWQYMTIVIVEGILTGYGITVCYLSMSNFAGDRTEQGFQLFQSTMVIMASVFSPLDQVWVNIL